MLKIKKYQPLGIGMTPSRTKLGKFLRARRLELGLRQVQVAKVSGIPQSVYSHFEIGVRKYLNPKELKSLATVLQCGVSKLECLNPSKKHGTKPLTELGKFIRERQEALGLTKTKLIRKLGLKTHYLGIERKKSIFFRHIQKWAKALKCNPTCLKRFAAFGGPRLKESSSALGGLIRSRRIKLNLSQRDVAKAFKVTNQFVSSVELGKVNLSRSPKTIEELARLLKLDYQELIKLQPKRRLKKSRNPATLGGFLATRRLELHLTQREVAKRTGRSQQLLCDIETNRYYPSSETLVGLMKTLKCEITLELISFLHQSHQRYQPTNGLTAP